MAKINSPKPDALFGFLSSKKCEVPSSLKRSILKRIPNSQIVPIQAAEKFMKNTVACMQLIEVSGIIIDDRHACDIWKQVPNLTPEANLGRIVDVIKKDGLKSVGHNTIGEAAAVWANTNSTSRGTALVVGSAPEMRATVGGLLGAGWKVVQWSPANLKRPSLPREVSRITNCSSISPMTQLIVAGTLPKRVATQLSSAVKAITGLKSVIDLQGDANPIRFNRLKRLSGRKLETLALDICVDILT
jgi:hypothetical protein